MTLPLILALSVFAIVSSITPGPNNLMLMASGANYGLRRTVPHMLGIAIGFTVMIVLVGLGLAEMFNRVPQLHIALKIGATIYMIYLAWKIATAAPTLDMPQAEGRPMTFLQAAAFQWVNPKAWAMALTAVTVYMPQNAGLTAVLIVALVFGGIGMPFIAVWAVLGVQLRRFLTTANRLRWFNWTMAILLVASLWPILRM